MTQQPSPDPQSDSSAIAERLRAHAQLCEQIARECWNAGVAEALNDMALACSQAAAEIAQVFPAAAGTRH